MSAEGPYVDADELAQKEQWAQSAAQHVTEQRGIDEATALASARWASMWVDDYMTLVESEPPTGVDVAREYIERSRQSSLERSDGISRYPSGVPTARAIIAADDVFCMAFGEEADDIWRLLHPEQEV